MTAQQTAILIFLTAMGGCIGSFLNVVVYRWPRGASVVSPGSRCPHCDHPIRGIHNIPVFSWLMLGGKCYDCKGPIAGRYALVEAIVAVVIFLGLAVHGFYDTDTKSMVGMHDPLHWTLYGFQVVLVCSLLCAYLIRHDGFPVPKALYATAVLGFIGAGTILLLTSFPAILGAGS